MIQHRSRDWCALLAENEGWTQTILLGRCYDAGIAQPSFRCSHVGCRMRCKGRVPMLFSLNCNPAMAQLTRARWLIVCMESCPVCEPLPHRRHLARTSTSQPQISVHATWRRRYWPKILHKHNLRCRRAFIPAARRLGGDGGNVLDGNLPATGLG